MQPHRIKCFQILTKKKLGQRFQDNDDDSERGSIISAMRKTRSIDASCLDMRSIGDVVNSSSMNMPRAKSEFNLTSSVVERKLVLILFLVKSFRKHSH